MNTRRSLIDEMAAQPRPKPQRTQPCANKLWKKAAKALWRSLASSGEHMPDAATGICRRCQLAGSAHIRRMAIRPKGANIGALYETFLANDIDRFSRFAIYGPNRPTYDTSIPNWWHPPTEWDWVWASPATEDAPAIRRRKPLDPGRLP